MLFSCKKNLTTTVDIYYGSSDLNEVTDDYILSNFSTASGDIGYTTGRIYTFDSTSDKSYKFLTVLDLPASPIVIDNPNQEWKRSTTESRSDISKCESDGTVIGMEPVKILSINGVTYKLYRTTLKYDNSIKLKVYSY
jgi:hypothetical protein